MRRQPASYLTMRVVVGKAMRTQTPVFANTMKYVIFRPVLAGSDLDPAQRDDPEDSAQSQLPGR